MGLFCLLDDRYRFVFFFSSRRRHTRFDCDWSSDVCSSDLLTVPAAQAQTLDSQIVMYDRLLQLDPANREARILRECGPIANAHLQAGCVDRDRKSVV